MSVSGTVVLGFVAGGFYIASHYMKTMVPLRTTQIIACALFVIYGILYPSWPTAVLYAILLPLNFLRLVEMRNLIKKVRTAAHGDLSMDWMKPFMHKRTYKKGDVLFRKGEHADEMFYVLSGNCIVKEMNYTITPGHMVGELGFLSPGHTRTQTVECADDVEMLAITYDKVRELYFQNPSFGFYLLKLTGERLLQNIDRLETEVQAYRIRESAS